MVKSRLRVCQTALLFEGLMTVRFGHSAGLDLPGSTSPKENPCFTLIAQSCSPPCGNAVNAQGVGVKTGMLGGFRRPKFYQTRIARHEQSNLIERSSIHRVEHASRRANAK